MVELSDKDWKQLKRLEAAVNQSLDGVAFTDLSANLVYVNQAFAQMHDYAVAELVGKHIYLFHNDEQKPQVDAAINQVKATGKYSGIIWRIHRNGTAFPSRMSISVFRDPKGIALGIIAVVRDITEQLRAEAAVRESEGFFREITENSSDVIVIVDRLGAIKYVSHSVEHYLGYAKEEVVGKKVFEFIVPADLPRALIDFAKAILVKQVLVPNSFRLRHKDGSERVFEGLGKNLFADPLVGGFVMNVHDATERKKAETELLILKNKYDAILTAVPNIIMEVDNNKVYTWANEAGKMFFGPDVVGKEAAAYFVGEQTTYQVVDPLFAGSEDVIYVESWQKNKAGRSRLLAWWCRTIKDAQGKVTGALSTARDITDQKKAEEALLQAMKELKLVNDVAIGNELKIIEREKEIDNLLKELGREAKYGQ